MMNSCALIWDVLVFPRTFKRSAPFRKPGVCTEPILDAVRALAGEVRAADKARPGTGTTVASKDSVGSLGGGGDGTGEPPPPPPPPLTPLEPQALRLTADRFFFSDP
jgi:hypothetical protein